MIVYEIEKGDQMLRITRTKFLKFSVFITTFLIISLCCYFEFKHALHVIIFASLLSFINTLLALLILKEKIFDKKAELEKKLKHHLRNNEKNFSTIINNMPMIAYIVDTDYNFIACNEEAINYFGININEKGPINQLSANIFMEDTLLQMKQENDFVVNNKQTFVADRPIKLRNGRQNWFRVRKIPIINGKNKITRLIVFARNIDQDKNEQRQRESYIATLSHDLKTPIIAQIRALELLANKNLGTINEGQKEIINLTLDSCYCMYDMLSTILTTYKYENNDMTLSHEKVHLLKILNNSFNKATRILREKELKIKITSRDKFISLFGDSYQVQKAFDNLIDFCSANAFSNTEISCSIKKIKDIDSIYFSIHFKCSDKTQETIQNMLEMYTTSAEKFNKIGSSINLYLVKRIINAHNGIILTETNNSNCNFIIEIPCSKKSDISVATY